MKDTDVIPKMNNGSQNIQKLYESCVKYEIDERIKIEQVEDILIQEVQNHHYNFDEINSITKFEINQYFFESFLLFQKSKKEIINKFIDKFYSFHCTFLKMNNIDESFFLLHLGNIYYNGNGVSQNFEIAKKYYEMSVNKNNPFALNQLAGIYTKRLIDEPNFPKLSTYFDSSESLNVSNTIYNSEVLRFKMLGDLYLKGIGVDKDYSKAINYYDLAGNLNNSDAYVKLGDLYANGEGVIQDYSKAIKYYKYAADMDNSEAFYRLGDLYAFGRGVEKNYSFAVKYYKLADKKDDSFFTNEKFGEEKYRFNSIFTNPFSSISLSSSRFTHNEMPLFKNKRRYFENENYISRKQKIDVLLDVGDRIFYGNGYNKSFLKAKECFDLASSKDSDKANCKLGVLFANGYGVIQDYTKAKHYFDLAIKHDNSDALNNLGVLYENGLENKNDYKKANYYYDRASKLGNSFAFINLALIHLYGFFGPKDILLSKVYLQISANYNNSYAYLYLGLLYYDPAYQQITNYTLAREYFLLSAQLKNPNAFNFLGLIYENGYGIDKNYLEAKYYYELSAQLNHPEAYYNLGRLYEKGKGVDKDYSKALFLYGMSANKNYTAALFQLAYLYSIDDISPNNLSKSIHFYSKCANIEVEKNVFLFSSDILLSIKYNRNIYRYRSINDLSLIYMFSEFKDDEKAEILLKQAAFSEYPFAQNNYGLYLQFILNRIEDAKYMYQRSSKNNFALAYYNLGYLYEQQNDKQSIKYYIQASELEDCPLKYHGFQHFDNQLNISKTLIICFANLKLTKYFFSEFNYEESKKYFIRVFTKLNINVNDLIYKFNFKKKNIVTENFFDYLKEYIINFPLFNLSNQSNIKINSLNQNSCINTVQNENKFSDKNKIYSNKDNHFSFRENLSLDKDSIQDVYTISNRYEDNSQIDIYIYDIYFTFVLIILV